MKSLAAWILVGVAFLMVGCEDETNDLLNRAQTCLDKADETNETQINKCRAILDDVNTQQADLIRCSADLMLGGLTTTKIVDAYSAIQDEDIEDQEAYFIGALALDTTAEADTALNTCQDAEVDSLIYIATLAKTGTYLEAAAGGFSDPPTEAEIETAIDNCQTGTGCDTTTIGETIILLEDVYCDGSNSDGDICEDINQAIADSNGDADTLAELFFCYVDDDPNGACP